MDDYLNRFEVLLRRGVFALEKIAAAVAPPKDEHRDAKPENAPGAVPLERLGEGREDGAHTPPLDGLPPVQRTVAETARAIAAAESKPDLVDWAEPTARAAATAQPRPAGVYLRPKRAVEPLSWDAPKADADDLRARLFALLRQKLGLAGDGAKLEARRRCVVESVGQASPEDLRRGISSLEPLPDYVAPPLPVGPVAAYTAAAGIARGCSSDLAAKLATALGDEKAPSLAELTRVHSQPVLAAAKKAAGIPAGSRAKDVGEARAVVMALPTVERPTPSRAEVLARKLGGSRRAVHLAEELAAAEAGRTKGSHGGGFAQAAAEILQARLGLGWDALARRHEALWDAEPTLGGVLALVDDAPDVAGEPLVPQKGA